MRLMITALSVLVLAPPVAAQQTTSTSGAVHDQIVRQNIRRHNRTQRQQMSDREMETDKAGLHRVKSNALREKVRNFYRDPTDEELKLLSPRPEDQGRFAGFLARKDTGLIKLIKDIGCVERPYVVVASEQCLKYSMPGAGTSYSFRKETHRIPTLADLSAKDGYFLTTRGALIQGILVNLGDMRVEDVSDQTMGYRYISSFVPETDPAKARDASSRLADGVTTEGFLYQSSLPIRNDSTYLLRSIAYEGFIPRSIETLIYDESRWDERKDVLVAFRVVRSEPDGSVTIQWKRLASKDAPKMKF